MQIPNNGNIIGWFHCKDTPVRQEEGKSRNLNMLAWILQTACMSLSVIQIVYPLA